MKLEKSDLVLIGIVPISAIVTVAFYIRNFYAAPSGSPKDWADFGGYVNGIMSPIVGLVTVIFIVKTLRAAISDAANVRDDFQLQQTRADMQKRLEGVLADWNRAIEQALPLEFKSDGAPGHSPNTFRDLFQIPWIEDRLSTVDNNGYGKVPAPIWQSSTLQIVDLIIEMSKYCLEYEKKWGDKAIADFYRHRVQLSVRALAALRLLPRNVVENMRVDHPRDVADF